MVSRVEVSDFALAAAFSLELRNNNAAVAGRELELSIPRGAESDEIMASIADGLALNSTVVKISLGHCLVFSRGSRVLFEALERNTTLQELKLHCTDDGAEALGHALASNTSLRRLCVDGRAVRDLGSRSIGLALLTNTTLQQLEMRSNTWGEAGGDALGHALACNTSLKSLKLEHCVFGPSVVRDLFGGLGNNSSLTDLRIFESINNLFEVRQDDGGRHMGDALASNGSLKFFQSFHTQLGVQGSTAFAEGLRANTTLQVLRILGDHTLGDAGAEAIGWALATNTTLKELNLGSCCIRSSGVACLVAGMRGNTTLESLLISNNMVGEGGAEAIKQALADNSLSVRAIDMTVCGLGARETSLIAEGLGGNTTLVELKLCSNKMGVEGVSAIAGALMLNTRLASLEINNCGVFGGGLTAMSQAMQANSTLKVLEMAGEEMEELNTIDFGEEGEEKSSSSSPPTPSPPPSPSSQPKISGVG